MHTSSAPVLDLSIKNDFDAMGQAMEQVDEFMAGHNVAPRAAYVVRLALDEILSNIIQYAFPAQGGHMIDLHLELADNELRLVFCDDGAAFNPTEVPPPDLDLALEDRPVGGLGIHMVRDMSKEMRYRRENGHNILEVLVSRQ